MSRSPADIERLRHDLDAASFSVGALEEAWGADAAAALFRGRRLPAVRALDARVRRARRRGRGDPLDVLARLFVLGLPVDTVDLERALPTLGVGGAERLGLIARRGTDAQPLVDLRPYSFTDGRGVGHWWIASDLGEMALGRAISEDHVLGVGGASATLAGLMIGDPVDNVLDLGTGCGIQALHASRHARRVVATDTSERALEFARFNAQLNGIGSIEFRRGNLFDPVEGERFDQIVSNPPFVITPRGPDVPAYEYRDGGMVGDALVQSVVTRALEHLQPGGIAQLLGNWEYHADADAFTRIRNWLEAAGAVDAWFVERERQDVYAYAETWIRDGGTLPGSREFDEMYAAWIDDFATRGVQAVGFGYITLRRGVGGARLLRLESELSSGTDASGLGEHLGKALRAHDWSSRRDDAALRSERLVVAADVTEERHYWPGAEDPTVISLRQGGAFGRTVRADTALAAFVGACDGELSVGAICGALAHLLDADEDALCGVLLPRLRELLFIGMLQPALAAVAMRTTVPGIVV